jgi:uncharacterized damage-inducible protein DinB
VTLSDHLRTLARYNHWANQPLFDACRALADETYRADRGAFFGSIHRTLNHILVGDRAWLGRLEGIDRGIRSLDQILYDDLPDLTVARTEEDARIIAFVDGLDPERLEEPLVYRTIAGEAQETAIGLVVLHMINHATHHRGQIHCMLSQIPTDPPPLDLIYFLREQSE